MMGDVLSLFDDEREPEDVPATPAMMTESQRAEIRSLFNALGIQTAREQFDFVAEATGTRITSVLELDAPTANVLISRLRGRVAAHGRTFTGNAWEDRTEDTWIDRL